MGYPWLWLVKACFGKWWIGARPVEILFGHLAAFQERELLITHNRFDVRSSFQLGSADISAPVFKQ